MKKIQDKNINTPERFYNIFINRWDKEIHYADWHKYEMLFERFKGGKCLDVGCMNSPIPLVLKRQYTDSEIWAMDFADRVIKELRKRHPDINYVVADARDIPFKDSYFDYIIAGDLIEHLEKPVEFIDGAMRILKVGGILALSTPADGYGNKHEEHLWQFNKKSLENILEKYGKTKVKKYKENLIAYVKKI